MKSLSGWFAKGRLSQQIDLLHELVSRDMKILYKRSMMGIAWTLINPLLQLAVFAFIFQIVLPVNIPRYSSFVFSGLLVWNWFQSSLFQATGVITNNRPLIRQPGFPVSILPVVTVMTGLIHFCLALPILIIFIAIDGIAITPALMYLPVLLLLQFVLTVSLTYPLAAVNVSFRDTQHILGVLLQLLFYLTPLFYDISHVPDRLQSVYYLNPMVILVESYRQIMIHGMPPNWSVLGILSLVSLAILPIGHRIFKRQSNRFVEEL
ncbi:MAG: ABC transporter permease [Scytolyngbya sp. HA4215-MV1]|nr:ABC transporter permease [Scytolyngbya sp. HA4215-MV1]